MQTFQSAIQFSLSPEFSTLMITKAEYAEHGSNISRRKFRDWKVFDTLPETPAEEPALVPTARAKAREKDDSRSGRGSSRPKRGIGVGRGQKK
jgi:actin-related protein 6